MPIADIREHREDAALEAAMRTDETLEKGDMKARPGSADLCNRLLDKPSNRLALFQNVEQIERHHDPCSNLGERDSHMESDH